MPLCSIKVKGMSMCVACVGTRSWPGQSGISEDTKEAERPVTDGSPKGQCLRGVPRPELLLSATGSTNGVAQDTRGSGGCVADALSDGQALVEPVAALALHFHGKLSSSLEGSC